mmetsp:Transcript_11915/g.35103  ORF Transcript_11915/g.35103 Transcript_11915/m.35103 type:complete len:238 (+) Transcript_11915:391-1104(+)
MAGRQRFAIPGCVEPGPQRLEHTLTVQIEGVHILSPLYVACSFSRDRWRCSLRWRRLGQRRRSRDVGVLEASVGWLGRGRLNPPVFPRQTPGAREHRGCQRHIDTPPPAVLGLAAHAADHVAEAHLAVLHGRVERHGQRVEELVRRLLQHLRRLLKKLPECASSTARLLLGDWCDGDATVHRLLHEARDCTALVEKGAFGEVEEEHHVAVKRRRVGFERLLCLSNRYPFRRIWCNRR